MFHFAPGNVSSSYNTDQSTAPVGPIGTGSLLISHYGQTDLATEGWTVSVNYTNTGVNDNGTNARQLGMGFGNSVTSQTLSGLSGSSNWLFTCKVRYVDNNTNHEFSFITEDGTRRSGSFFSQLDSSRDDVTVDTTTYTTANGFSDYRIFKVRNNTSQSRVDVYVDGILEGSLPWTSMTSSSTKNIRFAGWDGMGFGEAKFNVAEIEIWSNSTV